MTPAAERAASLPGDFRRDLLHHLDHGWIYSSPDSFGMAMLKHSAWAMADLEDPEIRALPDEADMWYFSRVAGDVAEVFSRLPFPMLYVGYRREKTDKTIRLTYERFQFLLKSSLRGPPRQMGFHSP